MRSRGQRRISRGKRVVVIADDLDDRLAAIDAIGESVAACNGRTRCTPRSACRTQKSRFLKTACASPARGSELLATGIPRLGRLRRCHACFAAHRSGFVADRPITFLPRPLRRTVLLITHAMTSTRQTQAPEPAARRRRVDIERAARRWLLIPPTRAVHLLLIHVPDQSVPTSPAAAMPVGIVE